MTDFEEMHNAVKRALMFTIEASDRMNEPNVAQLLTDAMTEAFDDLTQCLIEYGDHDLAEKIGDVSVAFAVRHQKK